MSSIGQGGLVTRCDSAGGLARVRRLPLSLVRTSKTVLHRFRFLLLLATVDLVIGLIDFHSLPIGAGEFAFGDLPGFYTFGSLNSSWLGGMAVYPLTEQFLSYAIGQPLAQNLLYLSILILPSFGIYAFLSLLTDRKLLVVAVAVAFGTIANPVLMNTFMGGGFEFGLLLFFGFLSLRCLWKMVLDDRPRMNGALSGLFFGLSLTEVGGYSGTEEIGVVMLGVFIVPILGYGLIHNWHTVKRALESFGAFAIAFVGVILVILLTALSEYPAEIGSASQSNQLNGFVLPNVYFTFRYYGLSAALFTAPQSLPNIYWFPTVVLPWLALVTAALLLGWLGLLILSGPRKVLVGIFLTGYFGSTLFIWGVQTGALVGVYTLVRPLDFLDDPFLLLVMQGIALPVFFVLGFEAVLTRLEQPRASSQTEVNEPRKGRLAILKLRRFARGYRWTPGASNSAATLLAVFVLLLSFLGMSTFAGNVPSLLNQSPALEGAPPNAPPALGTLQSWYGSLPSTDTGQILVLPNSFQMYDKVWGFVPRDRLWVIPYAGNILNQSYDVNDYLKTLELLAQGQGSAFAAALGFSGVEYIGVINQSTPITVVPDYLGVSGVSVNYSSILETLTQSGSFRLTSLSSGLAVFANLRYSGTHYSSTALVEPAGPSPVAIAGTRELLEDSNFSNPQNVTSWIRYPQSNVYAGPNGTAALTVNSTENTRYAVFAGTAVLTVQASGVTGCPTVSRGCSDVTFAANLSQTIYSVSLTAQVPSEFNLQVFAYWYNTSTPQSLFSETGSSLVAWLPSGSWNFSSNQTVPSFAKAARLYFYAFTNLSGNSGTVLVSSPSFTQITLTDDVLQNATQTLQAANLSYTSQNNSPGPLTLITPFSDEVPSSFWVATTILDPYPAQATAVALSPSRVEVDLLPLLGSVFGNGTRYAFITGSASGAMDVSGYVDGALRLNVTEPAASTFVAQLTLTAESSQEGKVFFEVSGNGTLAFAGYLIPPENQTGGVPSISIPLPIGDVAITPSLNRYDLSTSFVEQGTSVQQALSFGAGFVPLTTVLVVSAAWLWQSLRPRLKGGATAEPVRKPR